MLSSCILDIVCCLEDFFGFIINVTVYLLNRIIMFWSDRKINAECVKNSVNLLIVPTVCVNGLLMSVNLGIN